MQPRPGWRLGAAIFVVYGVWATSYLSIQQAMADIPPLLLSGLRCLLAASVLWPIASRQGGPVPCWADWRDPSLVGLLAISVGSPLLAWGLHSTPSGSAAVLFAVMPIMACLLMALWGRPLSRLQWIGAALGMAGVLMLYLNRPGAAGMGSGRGMALVLASAACTAAAAVFTARGRMPAALLWTACIQLLVGGTGATALGLALGERLAWPGPRALLAFVYLSLVVTACGYVAYNYLTRYGGPALSTSYAYANPPISIAVGVLAMGERVGPAGVLASLLVLCGVAITLLSTRPLSSMAPRR